MRAQTQVLHQKQRRVDVADASRVLVKTSEQRSLRVAHRDRPGTAEWPVTKYHAASLQGSAGEKLTVSRLRADLKLKHRHHIDERQQNRTLEPPRFEGLENEALLSAIRAYTAAHRTLGWEEARHLLFTRVDNVDGWVTCVYTGRKISAHGIPNPDDINVEHSWPKSDDLLPLRGTAAETDLHHLFPTDNEANARRASLPFGEVARVEWEKGPFRIGTDANGKLVAEPPDGFKGDLARAHFYIAATYGLHIPPEEEAVLKEWNRLDPVDAREMSRNAAITALQGKPNPFVNNPALADHIRDF